jgi:two-component system NarL family response regulator
VQVIASGGTWLSRSIAVKLAEGTPEVPALAISLSDPERALLHLLAEGQSNHAIGQKLGVSEKTIERRVSEICMRLGVTSRVAAAVRAVREAMI